MNKKMKSCLSTLLFFSILTFSLPAQADDYGGYGSYSSGRRGFTVGFGPIGNIFIIDTTPVLDAGAGGWLFFDYRFHQNVSFQSSFFISSQDADGISSADGNTLLLGMPCFDVKYYFLNDPHWDPFFSTGVGMYFLTEGNVENDTGGVGMGSQLGVGFDYHLTELLSLGFQGVFRTAGIITSLSGSNQSAAIYPYSLQANIGFHF